MGRSPVTGITDPVVVLGLLQCIGRLCPHALTATTVRPFEILISILIGNAGQTSVSCSIILHYIALYHIVSHYVTLFYIISHYITAYCDPQFKTVTALLRHVSHDPAG